MHRVIPVEICRRGFAGGGEGSAGGVVMDGGDHCFLTGLHRFIRWMKVLRRKGWGRGRIFDVAPGVFGNREMVA